MFLQLAALQWMNSETGEVDEVYLVYTDFVNMGRQVATVKKLLPLELEGEGRVKDFEHQSSGPVCGV